MGKMKEEYIKQQNASEGTIDAFKGLLKPIAEELGVGIERKYLSEILNEVVVKIKELKGRTPRGGYYE